MQPIDTLSKLIVQLKLTIQTVKRSFTLPMQMKKRSFTLLIETVKERWGAGVETQKNVRGEIGGWGRVPFNEPYAPSLSTIYDGA